MSSEKLYHICWKESDRPEVHKSTSAWSWAEVADKLKYLKRAYPSLTHWPEEASAQPKEEARA